MSDKFFIAFKNMAVAHDFHETLKLMNSYAGTSIVGIDKNAKINGQKGFFIINNGHEECYGILWRKYFMFSRGRHPEVNFWDEEYEKYAESQKASEAVIA